MEIPLTKSEERRNNCRIEKNIYRNLAYTLTEDDIEQLLSKYVSVTEVIMPVDRITRKNCV